MWRERSRRGRGRRDRSCRPAGSPSGSRCLTLVEFGDALRRGGRGKDSGVRQRNRCAKDHAGRMKHNPSSHDDAALLGPFPGAFHVLAASTVFRKIRNDVRGSFCCPDTLTLELIARQRPEPATHEQAVGRSVSCPVNAKDECCCQGHYALGALVKYMTPAASAPPNIDNTFAMAVMAGEGFSRSLLCSTIADAIIGTTVSTGPAARSISLTSPASTMETP